MFVISSRGARRCDPETAAQTGKRTAKSLKLKKEMLRDLDVGTTQLKGGVRKGGIMLQSL